MLVSQQNLFPHERIGRYEVLRKIATGGMAELFLAKQVGMEGFEKVVAIKRILAHLAFDEEFINMFRDEARIVAKLSHPNIVQIYDLGKSDDTYFIAMEYIPGRNLSSVAKKAKSKGVPLPPEYVARCIAQACEGLYYAHTRQDIDGRPLKIIHRDVSPQNIILAFSGGVKLVDFGIAKAATKIAHTRAGVLKGKYAYMSPEQIRGDEIDARSDLFAVGIVLYELLCGKRPFEKENSIQTLKAIVQEPHLDCRALNSQIPDLLAQIIDRALTKEPSARWSSAQELQLALEDFVTGTGRRCNNIAISKWVTDLFSEELSRDRGGTMVFKGVGEVILPDFEERAEAQKDLALEADAGSGSSSGAGEGSGGEPDDADGDPDGSGAVPLDRGRGGGSISIAVVRAPIPAPSIALRSESQRSGELSSQSSASGSSAPDLDLFEEGVIEHRPHRADSQGFSDDQTALATDGKPPEPRLADDSTSASDARSFADLEEPELQVEPRGPALYDDSQTEWAKDLHGGAPDPAARVVEAPSAENEPTWERPVSDALEPMVIPRGNGSATTGSLPDLSAREDSSAGAPGDPIAEDPARRGSGGRARGRLVSIGSEETAGSPAGRAPILAISAPAADLASFEDVSLDVEPLGPEDDEPFPLGDEADDPWNEATIGLPGGPPGVEVPDDPSEVEVPPARPPSPPPVRPKSEAPLAALQEARRSAAASRSPVLPSARVISSSDGAGVLPAGPRAGSPAEARSWPGLQEHTGTSTESGEVDLWDDKTATNDAYQAEPSAPSPVIEALEPRLDSGIDLGDATISSAALSDELLGGADELSSERTLNVFALVSEIGQDDAIVSDPVGMIADPTISAASLGGDVLPGFDREEEATAGGVPEVSADATLAGAPAIDSVLPDFTSDHVTTPSLDEEQELPEPRHPNRNVDADSRTMAGVTSDYLASGLSVPDNGTYDHEEGIELDLALDAALADSAIEEARPKPKRGGRGLGAIKLAKAPVEVAPTSRRFDPSEEMTEAGPSHDRAPVLPKLPRSIDAPPPAPGRGRLAPADFDREISAAFESAISEVTHDAEEPPPRPANKPRPELRGRSEAPASIPPLPPKALVLPKAAERKLTSSSSPAFDEPPLEKSVSRPPAPPPLKPSAAPLISAKIPPPMNPSSPSMSSLGIGSTNVPPASLSLSEMLAIPAQTGNGRSFQVLGRGGSVAGPPPGAPRPRTASMVRREIREVVRAPGEGSVARSELSLPAPGQLAPSFDLGAVPPASPKPKRTTQRIVLGIGIVLAFLALVGTVVLLRHELFPRDPQLTIRTTPDGADIYLNGQLQPAKTPAILDGLQPGVTYELRLTHEGFETVSKAVLIPKNTRNILVQIPLKAQAPE